MKRKIKTLLVDDHAILRMGLVSLLSTFDDIEVVGEVGSGTEALKALPRLVPDVAVVDLMMQGMDGAETTARLLEAQPGIRILILTTFGTADGIAHALDAGARGAVLKNVPLDELVTAIRAVAAGEEYVCRDIRHILRESPPVPALSARQCEIIEMISKGYDNNEIARQLGISLARVKEIVNTICNKFGAANRTEAAVIALKKHLLKI